MPWIHTYTGRKFPLLNPTPDDIDIEDIAHALSRICRFGGHTHEHYSVAQHSWHLSFIVPSEYAFEALMHDAPEFAIGDIVSPVKWQIPSIKPVEDGIWRAICDKFHLSFDLPDAVKEADAMILTDEVRCFMSPQPEQWTRKPGYGLSLHTMPANGAKFLFLDRFLDLFQHRVNERKMNAEMASRPARRTFYDSAS